MRLRTAAILSVGLIGGMFALRSLGYHLALSYVEQGVKEIPSSVRFFFIVTAFFYSFWWLLAPAIAGVLYSGKMIACSGQTRLHAGQPFLQLSCDSTRMRSSLSTP